MPTFTHIPVTVGLVSGWYARHLGEGIPNRFTASLDEVSRVSQERDRFLHERLGEFGLGDPDPQPYLLVPQHDGRLIIAAAYGAPYPRWDEISGSFWQGTSTPVWGDFSSAAEVNSIPLPDWSVNPLMLENMRKWEEVRARIGEAAAKEIPLWGSSYDWWHPVTGAFYRLTYVATFLDIGGFLMHGDDFFTLLAAEPEIADALMQKSFDISASLTDFMNGYYQRSFTGWCGLGGDYSCLLSPEMYRRYAMGFDAMMREKFGNVPRNLHSCGASKHLYETWADYPEREQIVLMQTRAIPGAMAPLRRALPQTYIELTIHQPQVDFERESPDRIREIVWELAEAMEFRDTSITVIISDDDAQCRANLAAFYEAAAEVNTEAERRAG